LDPRALREVLVFATHEGSVGGVFRTDWSKSAVFEAFQSRAGAVTETTRGDRPVLAATAGTDGAVGVLEDGVFAAGTAATVEAVRDCWRGDADPVGGDVREAFGNAGSGYARFGFDVPVGKIPAETGTLLDAGPLKELTYGYGSLREDRTLAVALRATGGAAATDVASILESGLALAREEARTAPESPRTERLRRVLAETAVESRDRTVTVRTASGVSALLVALETLAPSFLPGVGPARGRPTPPAVSVAVEYDPAARELVVVHEAGDFVPAGELYIRGEGVPTGRWDDLGGSTSVESGGHPAVAAGDRLVVPAVPPEYTVRLVWEARDDEARAVLVEHRGPGV
jgi:acyl-CoA synthetase (AMP-forming)/AMP-acid ligase II